MFAVEGGGCLVPVQGGPVSVVVLQGLFAGLHYSPGGDRGAAQLVEDTAVFLQGEALRGDETPWRLGGSSASMVITVRVGIQAVAAETEYPV